MQTGIFNKAEQTFREAMNIREGFLGNSDIRTLDSMIKLGVCLSEMGHFDESRSLLTSGLQLISRTDNDHMELSTLAKETLADL